MTKSIEAAPLIFPFPTPPEKGEAIEVAPGILWARIPLPFRLDHVNVYFIDDGDGWAVVDTGIDDENARMAWNALLSGPLAGRRLTRLIVTHMHPDHIGLAGWLTEKFDIPLLTSQTAYIECLNLSLAPGKLQAPVYRDFYLRNGLDEATTALIATMGHDYLGMVAPLPPTFERLVAGDELAIGGRKFEVLAGDGHAPEQLMLFCRDEKLFLAADQVLVKISPNVSVAAMSPRGDPLGLYLRSLRALKADLPADGLVLPGHQLPFYGLHERASELMAHHEARCEALRQACEEKPHRPAELLTVMFTRKLDPHQMGFAFSELLAHVNYMLARGELRWAERTAGPARLTAAA
ncbi:MBL fold metallo-hydrolase [Methylocapsa sp. S129]|uniref:MBL fold metallo-hydrolase n=1 Tax=Methylocapsa sp. S129 TaxID=1641869 RepID=UPI00131CC048|nr:MBL fold metallo-hydrolase [Methylocapsa sp. S129]